MAGERKQRKTTKKGQRVMSTVTSVRFPVPLLEQLNNLAEDRGIYTSTLINEILDAHVKRAARKPAAPALFG